MCGYCVEGSLIRSLEEFNPKVPTSGILLITYLQEVRDFPEALRNITSEAVTSPWVTSIIMCRAIEMLVVYGFESDGYQKLLQQPQFISAISNACAKGAEDELNELDTQLNVSNYAWLTEKDAYFVAGCFEKNSNKSSVHQCVSLLEEYIDWWLDGGSVKHRDLNQRMEDTGIMDPIKEIPESEHLLLEHRFPMLWFALLRISSLPSETKTLWKIIIKNPSGVPDFDGIDLWLQRRATVAIYDQQGFNPFLSEIQSIRPELIQYLVAVRTIKTKAKNAFMERIAELDSYHCGDCPPEVWKWSED